MKRIIAACVIGLILCCAATPAAAASTPYLSLEVSAPTVCAGQQVTVTLSLSDALPDVGSLELHLLYDADSLEWREGHAGQANAALQLIDPQTCGYTGVLFVYDYGTDGGAEKSFAPGTLLTATFAVLPEASADALSFSVTCAAALDTAFRPLALDTDAAAAVRLAHPTVAIRNFVRNRTVDFRTTVNLYAEVTDALPDGEIVWLVDGQEAATGETLSLVQMRQTADVTAAYRVGGQIAAASETETIQVKSGFFARLLALLRGWFGTLRTVEQSV